MTNAAKPALLYFVLPVTLVSRYERYVGYGHLYPGKVWQLVAAVKPAAIYSGHPIEHQEFRSEHRSHHY